MIVKTYQEFVTCGWRRDSDSERKKTFKRLWPLMNIEQDSRRNILKMIRFVMIYFKPICFVLTGQRTPRRWWRTCSQSTSSWRKSLTPPRKSPNLDIRVFFFFSVFSTLQCSFFGKVLFLTSAQSNQLTKQTNGTKALQQTAQFYFKARKFHKMLSSGQLFCSGLLRNT